MRITLSLIFCTFLGLACGQAHAQDCQIEKRATLPINYERYLPTVAIMINGHSVNMGVDTGAERTFVTPEAAEEMHLPNDPHHMTQSIGVGGSKTVNNVMVDDISFGLAHLTQQSMAVNSLTSRLGSQDFGPTLSLGGLLGADILSQYDIEYDVTGRTLSLYSVSNCAQISPLWEGDYARLPTKLTSHKLLLIPVSLDKHVVMAIFDTGASGLFLTRSSAAKAGFADNIFDTDPVAFGSGVNNQSFQMPIHMFEGIIIGKELYRGLRVGIVNSSLGNADMLVGENYMNEHRFWLSYSTGTLFIQRNAAR